LSKAKEIQSHGKGATVQGITIERLSAIQIPLPPLEGQRRIAAILDRSDQLLSRSRLLVQAVPLVEQSIFESLFGEFINGDPACPIKALGEIVEDSRIGLVRASNECGPELPCSYLKMDAIGKNGRLLLHKATRTNASPEEPIDYSVQDGDVLFNTRNSRELVGKTAVYRGAGKMLFNNNLMRLRFSPDTVYPDFFRLFLGSRRGASELESRKSGTTSVCAIYWKNLRTMPVPLPPYELQLQLVKSLESLERLANKYFQQEARCNDLGETLKSHLISGNR
jgi:type I restriction enzyme S subunit